MKSIDAKMGGWLRKTVLDWALLFSAIPCGLIAYFTDDKTMRAVRVDVGMAQVGVGTALLGIILAGLAILVVFLDKRYIAVLQKVEPGIDADLWPFKYTALIAIICAAFGMGLIVLGTPPLVILRIVFGLSLWSFAYLLWVLFDLVKFVAGHAKARAVQLQNEEPGEKN